MTFPLAEKMKQLEEIEAYFQDSDIDLEKGILKHKEAMVLAKELLTYLEEVEVTVKQLDSLQTEES